MKRLVMILTVITALVLSMAGCRKDRTAENTAPAAENAAPAAEPQVVVIPSESSEPAQAAPSAPAQAVPSVPSAPAPASGRQDGERFEGVITLEGMEETVRYEHIRSEAAGVEMDYDYELFVRRTGPDRERFISVYDDPEKPENYLEVEYRPEDAETVSASISEALSSEYEIRKSEYALDRAGTCIRIDADEVKGGGFMPDHLQLVYIIPAEDGCRVATEHYETVESEGFGRRFRYFVNSIEVVGRNGGKTLSDEQALAAVQKYCYAANPDLENIVKAGETPVYWEIASGNEQEAVVLFRSYTGAQTRYYIDRATGDTYVTEFVPGITPAEERTEETLNVWEYLG